MPRNINAKRIIVKIGTNVITNKEGTLDLGIMKMVVGQIAKIKNNKDIIIITSGAIGAGMKELNLKEKPSNVVMKQVCAAVGQNILMTNYYALFSRHKIKIAQILLDYGDFTDKNTYHNLRNSIEKLLELGAIPIINENDPVSINEIGPSFGDNDMMSALIASRIKADLLIILTNVDGLFSKEPSQKGAVLVKDVRNIDKKITAMGGNATQLGSGGMKTKIEAARMATKAGTLVVIANGRKNNVLNDILTNRDVGTIFYPKK